MASPASALYLSCLILCKMVQVSDLKESPTARQEQETFLSIHEGQNLTLRCHNDADSSQTIYWYKHTLGQKAKLIVSFHNHRVTANVFINDPRFKINEEHSTIFLNITDLRVSDSATYHCVSGTNNSRYSSQVYINFPVSVTVSVMGSGSNVGGPSLPSGPVQSGGSGAPSCTVHTGSCDGQHHVYWFKSSQESLPGLFYTLGATADRCDTHTNTCVYNLPINSLNEPRAGTYHCAVASCGHVLFGNGTKLDSQDPWKLVYFLTGALTFTIVSSISLAVYLYKITKRNSSQSAGSEGRISTSHRADSGGHQDSDSLHYAALSINKPDRSRRVPTPSNNDCVYAGINA